MERMRSILWVGGAERLREEAVADAPLLDVAQDRGILPARGAVPGGCCHRGQLSPPKHRFSSIPAFPAFRSTSYCTSYRLVRVWFHAPFGGMAAGRVRSRSHGGGRWG